MQLATVINIANEIVVNEKSSMIFFLSGTAFCMGLFSLIAFFYNRRQEFFHYFFYLLFSTVYFFYFPIYHGDGVQGYNNSTEVSLRHLTEVLINLFYTLFAVYYLDLKSKLPFAYKLSMVLVFFQTIFASYYLLSIEFYNDTITEILRKFRIYLMSIAYLVLISFVVFKLRNKLVYITLFGSLFLLIGITTFRITGNSGYLIFFICIELIVFGLGLLYKVRLIDIERNKVYLEAEINKKRALRAQINPHFIFNSLSSIQHLVTKNDRISALNYLSKFSRLTRNILESSIETNVVLSDEIKMLEDYLELESLRFDNVFNYAISLNEDIDTNTIEIPFMLLQPFVENAIIHGLLPKREGDKELIIHFDKEEDYVVCKVEDNGVGRAVAANKQHIHKRKKQSRGLQVTKQRLETLGLTSEAIDIIDKTDENGEASGTIVTIKIPLK